MTSPSLQQPDADMQTALTGVEQLPATALERHTARRRTCRRVSVGGVIVGVTLAACGGTTSVTEPPTSLPLANVSVGALHTCGLSPTGTAYCWGFGGYGSLGDSTQHDTSSPVPVSGGFKFTALSAGEFYTCAVALAGSAYCWGDNGFGFGVSSLTPVAVPGGLLFASVSAGGSHTCGLTSAGAAYCWGSNYDGQLGTGGTPSASSTPVAVSGGLTFVVLSAGESHTCGVTAANVAYCWGLSAAGALGNGTTTGPEVCPVLNDHCSTIPVAVLGGLTFTTVSAGTFHTCGVTTAGKAYCWGTNDLGQLGNGTTTASTTPVLVTDSLSFSSLSAGGAYTCGVTTGGAAVCWGAGGGGRLGNGSTANSTTPVSVSGGLTFTAVSSGHNGGTACGIAPGHSAYCWGSDFYGQLGDGKQMDSPVPGPVGH